MTKEEKLELLKGVKEGADITSRYLALQYRKLEKEGLVDIVKCQTKTGVWEKLPYFGCIVSDIGRKWLEKNDG